MSGRNRPAFRRGVNQSGCAVQKRLESDHRRRVRTTDRTLAALRARCNCHRCVARREREART